MKFTLLLMLLSIITLTTSCNLNRFLKENDKPKYTYNDKAILPDTSNISIDLNLDLKTLEKEINELFSKEFSDNGTGEFSEQYRAKEKNPLYDPKKTLKTKNPFYSPNKMISKTIRIKAWPINYKSTVKVKNLFYNPNEWIYTDNPLYNPNKWIYANTVKVNIGYTYQYEFKKRKDIKFNSLNDNALRVVIPIEVKGNVGFKGLGAKLLSLTGKNFRSKVDITIDIKIDMDENWCPTISSKIHHNWIEEPQIEIAHKLWVKLDLPADLAILLEKPKLEKLISESIPCNEIQESVKKIFIPGSISLESTDTTFGFTKNMYLNYSINKVGLSNLLVKSKSINMLLNAEMTANIGKKETKVAPLNLPKLNKVFATDNSINLSVPIAINYKDLTDNINSLLKDTLEYTFDSKFKIGNKVVELNDINVKVLGFELYPSDSLVTIGVKLITKFPNKLLSMRGEIYLTAKPVVINDEFSLSNIEFTTKVDNPLYPLINTLFTDKITDKIKGKTKKDLKPYFLRGIKIGENLLDKKLLEINMLEIKRYKPTVSVSNIIIKEKEIVIISKLTSGIKINIIKK